MGKSNATVAAILRNEPNQNSMQVAASVTIGKFAHRLMVAIRLDRLDGTGLKAFNYHRKVFVSADQFSKSRREFVAASIQVGCSANCAALHGYLSNPAN